MSSQIIIAANRLPVSVTECADQLRLGRSPGGLAAALAAVFAQYHPKWVGWTGVRCRLSQQQLHSLQLPNGLMPVNLGADLVKRYYDNFANGSLWPAFHGIRPRRMFTEADWRAAQEVTSRFARAIAAVCAPGDIIWVHDYHLILLPTFLRQAGITNKIGFFLHTPFPALQVMATLPYYTDMVQSLLAADVIGFQTERDRTEFKGVLRANNIIKPKPVTLGIFPIGVDFDLYDSAISKPAVKTRVENLLARLGKTRILLSISRLDYTKGILTQIKAVEHLLVSRPQLQGTLVYRLVVAPSREGVAEYSALKQKIDAAVERVNGRFAHNGWQPIDYSYKNLGFNDVTAWYHVADILLVAPDIDGMNLVAKEYVATRRTPGMLVMSSTAGAATQLTEALVVQPNNPPSTARALAKALDMPIKERDARWENMRAAVRESNVFWWTEHFLKALK